MKKIITFLILILTISLNAQNYFINNPQWRQSSECRIGDCIESRDYVYYLNGDSTIGNLTYKKVFRHGILDQEWFYIPPIPDWCDSSWSFNHFYALVRQEGYRIYIRQWNEPDTLLYDFDLAVGDTLPITWNQEHEDLFVSSIDSIIVDNSYRRVFNVDGIVPSTLIEGIGHLGGFLEPFPPIFECAHNLLCYAVNDTTYYPNYGDPCDLSVDLPLTQIQRNINCYPNPVSNNLTLYLNYFENIEKVISYNVNGQQKPLEFEQINQNKLSIDMLALKQGIYIIQLNRYGKVPIRLKIIKK